MRLSLVLALAVALAGCASEAAPPSASDAPGLAPAGEPSRVEDGFALLAWGAPRVDETLWLNGSFRATQARRLDDRLPGVADSPEPDTVVLDITGKVPHGVPVKVIADVDAKVGARGDVDVFLRAPHGSRRSGWGVSPYGGSAHVEWTLVHEAGDVLVVLSYDVAAESAEVPYAMSVRVVHEPEVVPSALALGVVFAEPPVQLTVELTGEKREQGFEPDVARVTLIDPQDRRLGAFPLNDSGPTRLPLPEGAPLGEYVLMLSQGGRSARIAVPLDGGATMRPLQQPFLVAEPRPGQSANAAEWSYEYDRAPLLAGIAWWVGLAAQEASTRLEGPEGLLFEGALSGGPLPWYSLPAPEVGFESAFFWDSGFGVEGLVAGTYKARVAFAQHASAEPLRVAEYAMFYER